MMTTGDNLQALCSLWSDAEVTDLSKLVELRDGAAELQTSLQAASPTAAAVLEALSQTAERIVLEEVDDRMSAMETAREAAAWLSDAAAQDFDCELPAAIRQALAATSGCKTLADARTEASGAGGARCGDWLADVLNAVALDLSTWQPGQVEALARTRDLLTERCQAGALAEPLSEKCDLALTLLDACIEESPEDASDARLTELFALIEDLQELCEEQGGGGAPGGGSQTDAAGAKADTVSAIMTDEETDASIDAMLEAAAAADPELIGEFVSESMDHVDTSEAVLLDLETDPEDSEKLNAVFRAFHTIKGTAGFLGLGVIQELAHRAESLLDRARGGQIRLTGGYADLALESLDMLRVLIQDVLNHYLSGSEVGKPTGLARLLGVLDNPEAAGYGDDEGATGEDSPRLGDLLVASGKASREDVEQVMVSKGEEKIGQALVRSSAASGKDVRGALKMQQRMSGNESHESLSVKVRLERLDSLIDTVGELVIAQSMVAQDETVLNGGASNLARNVGRMGKITRELQDLSMSLRMVPLKSTFQKMNRLVRDLASRSGKPVKFVTQGEETEIDRNMVEIVNDPLVHMIRNAVDHGIESPEERKAAGKPAEGTVMLRAYHSAGRVLIELVDDGKGLDRDRIVAKAVERGIIQSSGGLSDSEVYDLIFEPGFSTAEQVTEVSGRGVGMDVVKRGIDSLNGRVEVDSAKGRGTTFTIQLPLTLAIIDGMVVKVADQRYIVPTANIHTSFRPETDALSVVTGRGEMVTLQGRLLPVFRLHELFKIDGAVTRPTEGLLLVIEGEGGQAAVLVDDLLGQQQVVVKSLSGALGSIKGISGGAILGDGRVGLIVDAQGLVGLARSHGATHEAAAREPAVVSA